MDLDLVLETGGLCWKLCERIGIQMEHVRISKVIQNKYTMLRLYKIFMGL